MNGTFPPYLDVIRAALSGWLSWVQTAVEVVYSLVVALGPAPVIVTIIVLLGRRDTERTIRRMRRRTDEMLAHRRRAEAERQRLHDIKDQLWLERLPERRRAEILGDRRQAADRGCRAREILRREQEIMHGGNGHHRAGERPEA